MKQTINSEKTEGATVETASGSMLAHRESVAVAKRNGQAKLEEKSWAQRWHEYAEFNAKLNAERKIALSLSPSEAGPKDSGFSQREHTTLSPLQDRQHNED